MIYAELNNEILTSPIRTNKARVELLEGSTLLQTFTYKDALINFDIQRVGEGKFFGFGICQRLNVHLRDLERQIDVSTANSLDISFGAEHNYVYPYPNFKVSEVHRDEKTNELSITAYDVLYGAAEHTVSELGISQYSIREFAVACATLLGLPLRIMDVEDESVFDARYDNGANFEGSETIREALNAIAEATQTIYYVSANWELVFRRLDKDGEPVATIDKAQYIELKNGDNRRLANVCHATELGDNYVSTRRSYAEGNPVIVNDCAAGKPMDITIEATGPTGKNIFNVGNRVVRDFGALPNTTIRNFTENSVYLNLAINNYCNAGHKMKCEIVSDNSFTVLTPSNSVGGWEAYGAGFNFRTKPNITYSVSASYDNTKGKILGFSFYNATGKYISSTASTQNVITPNNTAWMNVVFAVQVRDEAVLFENIQLEEKKEKNKKK